MFFMDGIEIRPLREDEFGEALWVGSMAFGEHLTPADQVYHQKSFDFERSMCAFEDGKLVGTSSALSLELTLPGGNAMPTGGLTWIAVLPTHRRQGILRRLMAAQLQDMVRRGEPLSALLASEGNIYGRFGYGPATSVIRFQVPTAHAAFLEPARQPGRTVLLKPEMAAVELPAIYEDLRLGQPGAVSRPTGWWQLHLHDPEDQQEGAGPMFHARHETSPGVADGYVTYRVKEDWLSPTPANLARVVELMASTPGVYAALWDYLLNLDLVQTVSFSRGRVDEPLRWLLADPRRFSVDALSDYLWLRLLDVTRALSAREYGASGELVLEVTDPFPEPRTGLFLLQTESSSAPYAECLRTRRSPDLALHVDALSTAYLGGISFSTLAAAGRVRELRAGALRRADGMFCTSTAPYCVTMF